MSFFSKLVKHENFKLFALFSSVLILITIGSFHMSYNNSKNKVPVAKTTKLTAMAVQDYLAKNECYVDALKKIKTSNQVAWYEYRDHPIHAVGRKMMPFALNFSADRTVYEKPVANLEAIYYCAKGEHNIVVAAFFREKFIFTSLDTANQKRIVDSSKDKPLHRFEIN